MSLQIGIVGLPNVGKSTLFKALTKKQVDASNYPFCTIDPNVGVVPVPDDRLEQLAKMSKSKKIVPTTIEFVDIAGLVKGAHKGEGLGNKFLANIREVDAIVQVVREFKDPNVTHVHNRIDPKDDIEIINLELVMADLESLRKHLIKVEKDVRGHVKEAPKEKEILEKVLAALNNGQLANTVQLDIKEELPIVQKLNLLTLKPFLYVYNIDEKEIGVGTGRDLSVQNMRSVQNTINISAKIEAELSELSNEDAGVMMQELGMKETGLNKLITASYKLLNLISFLTTGEDETRAWTIRQGAKAPNAAGVIHTDFEKGFIRAEVVNWQKLLEASSWSAARDKGWLKMEGKDYVFADGDVTEFHHS